MAEIRGFPPIAQANATVLILGSMPGRESLEKQQYYAYPRNAFWPIMAILYPDVSGDYASRTRALCGNGVAVWDVLQACFRTGSLDSGIDDQSMVVNDFNAFYDSHPHIERVFFNGGKAEAVYLKRVLPGLCPTGLSLALQRLPSTSPAHAAISLQQKANAWRVIHSLE